jgi:hypothetical protein
MTEPETQYSRTANNFIGLYTIIPGQYIHLDNQYVELEKNSLKITTQGSPDKIFRYTVIDQRLRKYYGSILPVLELRVSDLDTYNVAAVDPVENLLIDILDMRAPNVFYMVYDTQLDSFALKDANMSTLFIMEKVASI